jgi:hypothetical protein
MNRTNTRTGFIVLTLWLAHTIEAFESHRQSLTIIVYSKNYCSVAVLLIWEWNITFKIWE